MTDIRMFLSLSTCLALNIAGSANAAEELRRYIVPDDVTCKMEKTTKVTFCSDKEGAPITGEMIKYSNGTISRYYPMKDGYLDGTGMAYYTNGAKKSEISYIKGVINGITKNYDKRGTLLEEIPYVDGKKEGVARYYDTAGNLIMQMIYIEDKANGDMRVYDPLSKTPIYNLKTASDKIISGTYSYEESEEIKTVSIPDIIISAINVKCLEMQTELSDSPCAAYFSNDSECDQKWRNKNRNAVREYLRSCAKDKK